MGWMSRRENAGLAVLREVLSEARRENVEQRRELRALEREVARIGGALEQLNSELARMRAGEMTGLLASPPRDPKEEEDSDREAQALQRRFQDRFGDGLSTEDMARLVDEYEQSIGIGVDDADG